jgi:DtxR family Mn-dependent transcriptional regulator
LAHDGSVAGGPAVAPPDGEQLSASQEDYLEAILQLERSSRVARVSDIASQLNVSRPSVTGALKGLVGRGLVDHVPYGHATLTEEGTRIALEVERRHLAIRDFLTDVLGIEEQRAEVTACRLEHVLEPEVLAHFVAYGEGLARGGPARQGTLQEGSPVDFDNAGRRGTAGLSDGATEESDRRRTGV